MKYIFIILCLIISTSSFAQTEKKICKIYYPLSKQTHIQACIKETFSNGSFSLMGINKAPLDDNLELAVLKDKEGYFSLYTKLVSEEIYDLGYIRKDVKRPGCYLNAYYHICLK